MLTDSAIAALRSDLLAADYTLGSVSDRLGPTALAALARNSSLAARRVLGEATDPQADAIRLWLLQQAVPAGRLAGWSSLAWLRAAGLLTGGAELRAAIELKPHGSDRVEGWICCDQTPLDGRVTQPRPDFVLGASPASTTLTQLVPPRHYRRVLDLGTGCGIQALHLDADEIVATDLNPRALELARIGLGLSGVTADLRLGSLYDPVAGEKFDLIVTNPPYVLSPPSADRLVYREGGFSGDDLMRTVVSRAGEHLADAGLLVVLGNWAVVDPEPWTERVAAWIGDAGCDALVLQRELLDPYEYVELWLADAGLAGSPDYERRYAEWLDYFDTCGIGGVGMGWIVLARSGRRPPVVRVEEWPHAVHQPVGQAFGDFFAAIASSQQPDAEFRAGTLRLHPGVVQESIAVPGAADPSHIVLRQQFGFGRAVEVGTALAAIVGACDGDLPVDVLISAVAVLLEVPAAELGAELTGPLRELVADGFLTGVEPASLGGAS
ncbi:MAG: methyltransferase [Propionicimonas sp.]